MEANDWIEKEVWVFSPTVRMDSFDLNCIWGACSRVDLGDDFIYFGEKCRFKSNKIIFELVNLLKQVFKLAEKESKCLLSVFSPEIHLLYWNKI